MTAAYGGFGGPGQRFRAATRTQITSATFFRGPMPVSPTGNAFHFSNRPVIPNTRFTGTNRRFFQTPQASFRGFERHQPGAPQAARDVPLHGVPPNRARTFTGQGSPSTAAPARESAGGWQRFGNPSNSNRLRESFTSESEQSGWHRFGQPPQRPAPRANSGSRSEFGAPAMPRYSTPPAPRYSAPATPRYSAPRYNAPHSNSPRYSAPPRSSLGENGGSRAGGGGGSHGGGSHGSGGGGHSSGGHRR
jgi:uncharacterized membrane protein YgcG